LRRRGRAALASPQSLKTGELDMTIRLSMVLSLLLIVAALGCAAPVAREGEETSPELETASAASFELNGYRWVKTRDVTYVEPEATTAKAAARSFQDHDVRTMSLDRIIEKLTPVMEFQGVEYTLDEESKVRYATTLREAALAEGARDEAGLLDEETVEQPQFDADEEGRVGRVLIGVDNRTRVNNPSSLNPQKMIGVYFNLAIGGSAGTVFKACNRHTAMTAAHALHNGTNWLTRQNIRFGHSSANPSPTAWVGTSCWFRVVPAGWDSDKDRAYDYGIIGFHGGIGAACTLATYDVGNFVGQTVGSGVSGLSGSVTGYPDKLSPNPPPGVWTAPEMFTHLNSTGATSSFGLFPTQLWHQNDTTDGQSGAPYWTNSGGTIRVRGIHWGWDPGNGTNAARRWNSELDSFCTANGGN
jgi:V8-like Glu-specific endopeptidase